MDSNPAIPTVRAERSETGAANPSLTAILRRGFEWHATL